MTIAPGLIVGLTGGIGSGKSAAADRFAALGAAVVDTDAIAHELTGPPNGSNGAAMPAIAQAFGPDVVRADGALDRAAMRAVVFADPGQRQRLESILHPMIRRLSDERVASALIAGAPYAVLVVPLLVESGTYRQRVHRVAVVDCSEATQVQRVMRRNGMGEAEVLRILAAQASRAERLAVADDVIDNEGDLSHLARQVDALDAKYRET